MSVSEDCDSGAGEQASGDDDVLAVEALTAAAFAPFGDVIAATAPAQTFPINDGTAQRFHELGRVDCDEAGGYAAISLVRAQPRALPFSIRLLERHPHGSQAFIPQSKATYLVVVAESPTRRPRAFLATGGAGVNFRRGTWHHPLLALQSVSDFIVVDRCGDAGNCEEVVLDREYRIDPLG